jgi:hypothetical protein
MVVEVLQHLVDSGLQVVEVVEIPLIQVVEEMVALVEVVKEHRGQHLIHIMIMSWVK